MMNTSIEAIEELRDSLQWKRKEIQARLNKVTRELEEVKKEERFWADVELIARRIINS